MLLIKSQLIFIRLYIRIELNIINKILNNIIDNRISNLVFQKHNILIILSLTANKPAWILNSIWIINGSNIWIINIIKKNWIVFKKVNVSLSKPKLTRNTLIIFIFLLLDLLMLWINPLIQLHLLYMETFRTHPILQ